MIFTKRCWNQEISHLKEKHTLSMKNPFFFKKYKSFSEIVSLLKVTYLDEKNMKSGFIVMDDLPR